MNCNEIIELSRNGARNGWNVSIGEKVNWRRACRLGINFTLRRSRLLIYDNNRRRCVMFATGNFPFALSHRQKSGKAAPTALLARFLLAGSEQVRQPWTWLVAEFNQREWLLVFCWHLSEHFQSGFLIIYWGVASTTASFRAVLEQFQSSFGAVLEQF